MKLNENFNPKFENIINSYEPLENWFDRNQETLVHYGMTHKGCLHFEDKYSNNDIVILGRMANYAYTWLEMPEYVLATDEEKALYASMAMEKEYERSKSRLSDTALEQYYISTGIVEQKEHLDSYSYKKK